MLVLIWRSGALIAFVEPVDVVQLAYSLTEVHGELLQLSIGRVEDSSVDARIHLVLDVEAADRILRLLLEKLLPRLVPFALHHSGLEQVQTLLDHIQLHQALVHLLAVLQGRNIGYNN